MEEYNDNFLLIFLDPSCQLSIDIKKFQHIINCIQSFDDSNSCIDYITGIKNQEIFLIIPLDQTEIIPLIHDISQLDSIYVMCVKDQEKIESNLSQYRKIRGQFTTMDELYQQLNNDTNSLLKSLIKINTLPTTSTILTGDISESKNNIQEATFMYSKVLRDIFIKHLYTENDKLEMIEFVREEYKNNQTELQKIENFQREYISENAIYWYTIDGFLYRMINKALRSQDIITLYHLRYFLKDLHLQLEKHYSKQSSNTLPKKFCVYRGLGLPNGEFEKLQQGGLVSFSEFLSTSKSQQLAEIYILRETDDMQPILFEIELDYTLQISNIFADISNLSQFNSEDEVLLSMGSVFRIESLQRNSDNIWYIKLTLTSDEDPQLKLLYQWMKNAVNQNQHIYMQLAGLMLFIHEYDHAEFFLRKVLNESNLSHDTENLNAISSIFGEIYFHKGDYERATKIYEQLIELYEKHPEEQQLSTIQRIYTGLSEIYLEQEQYAKALEYSQKSLDIILSDNYMKTVDLLLASRYNNIGYIYIILNKFEQSLTHLHIALDYTKSLPSNIPIISKIYCNIAINYEQCQDYLKSELYWKKGLEHHLQSMPNNTNKTACLYIAVALNLIDHQKYQESIYYLNKALIISINKNFDKKTLYSCYKHLATSYHFLQNFKQANEYLQKALIIAKDLPYIDMAILYTDIGKNFYRSIQNEQALDAFNKALEFAHPTSRLPIHALIFAVYTNQNKPNRALNYYKLNIKAHITELDQDELVRLHLNIGMNYYQLKNYAQALTDFKIALNLIASNQLNAPSNQLKPNVLKRIVSSCEKLDQWSEVNEYGFQLLEYEQTADTHMKIGVSYYKQGKLREAIDYMKKAYELAQTTGDHSQLIAILQLINIFTGKMNDC